MNIVKIFLASSIVEFEQARDKLAARIRGLNNEYVHKDIYFELYLSEDYSDVWVKRRKQEEYNDLIRTCDFFFALIGAHVGPATLEEIDVAREQFQKSGGALSPKIVIFFQDLPMEALSAEVIRLKEQIREMGQYPPKFTHISEVTQDILMELIESGTFFKFPVKSEMKTDNRTDVTAQIRENREKIADTEAALSLLYQKNVSLSKNTPFEFGTRYEYAFFLYGRDKYEKAIEIGVETESYDTNKIDLDDRALMKDLLGDCYAALGRYEEAEIHYHSALKLYQELTDKESDDYAPDLAKVRSKLAGIMFQTYRHQTAEQLYQKALAYYLKYPKGYATEIGRICHTLAILSSRNIRGNSLQ